ncbi:hypothetical protein, partial [Streptomyces sp. NPDC050428]|uniref:hypothetical protein n=1 Tax=Streptomyces sp. NPDC050428 TaxID=3155757 RepID=UPI003422D621
RPHPHGCSPHGSSRHGADTVRPGAVHRSAASAAEPADRASGPSGYVVPIAFIGATCLAAPALLLLWRAARRRRDPADPDGIPLP